MLTHTMIEAMTQLFSESLASPEEKSRYFLRETGLETVREEYAQAFLLALKTLCDRLEGKSLTIVFHACAFHLGIVRFWPLPASSSGAAGFEPSRTEQSFHGLLLKAQEEPLRIEKATELLTLMNEFLTRNQETLNQPMFARERSLFIARVFEGLLARRRYSGMASVNEYDRLLHGTSVSLTDHTALQRITVWLGSYDPTEESLSDYLSEKVGVNVERTILFWHRLSDALNQQGLLETHEPLTEFEEALLEEPLSVLDSFLEIQDEYRRRSGGAAEMVIVPEETMKQAALHVGRMTLEGQWETDLSREDQQRFTRWYVKGAGSLAFYQWHAGAIYKDTCIKKHRVEKSLYHVGLYEILTRLAYYAAEINKSKISTSILIASDRTRWESIIALVFNDCFLSHDIGEKFRELRRFIETWKSLLSLTGLSEEIISIHRENPRFLALTHEIVVRLLPELSGPLSELLLQANASVGIVPQEEKSLIETAITESQGTLRKRAGLLLEEGPKMLRTWRAGCSSSEEPGSKVKRLRLLPQIQGHLFRNMQWRSVRMEQSYAVMGKDLYDGQYGLAPYVREFCIPGSEDNYLTLSDVMQVTRTYLTSLELSDTLEEDWRRYWRHTRNQEVEVYQRERIVAVLQLLKQATIEYQIEKGELTDPLKQQRRWRNGVVISVMIIGGVAIGISMGRLIINPDGHSEIDADEDEAGLISYILVSFFSVILIESLYWKEIEFRTEAARLANKFPPDAFKRLWIFTLGIVFFILNFSISMTLRELEVYHNIPTLSIPLQNLLLSTGFLYFMSFGFSAGMLAVLTTHFGGMACEALENRYGCGRRLTDIGTWLRTSVGNLFICSREASAVNEATVEQETPRERNASSTSDGISLRTVSDTGARALPPPPREKDSRRATCGTSREACWTTRRRKIAVFPSCR